MKNIKKAPQSPAAEPPIASEATPAAPTPPLEEKIRQPEEIREPEEELPPISPEPLNPEEPVQPEVDNSMQRQLEEAEQRGYLRGRNERIQQLMQEPAPLERPSVSFPSGASADTDQASPMILNNPRVSIWDR